MSYDISDTLLAVRNVLVDAGYTVYVEGQTVSNPPSLFLSLQTVMVTPDKEWCIVGFNQVIQVQVVSTNMSSAAFSRVTAGEVAGLLTDNKFFVESIRPGVITEGSISTVVTVQNTV